MGTLQARSFNLRPTVDPSLRVKVRRERRGRIDSRASRQLNSDRSITSREMGENGAVIQQAITGNADAHLRQ